MEICRQLVPMKWELFILQGIIIVTLSIIQVLDIILQEDPDAIIKTTNCPLRQLPKGHVKNHHLSQLPLTADMRLKTMYTGETDKRRSDYEKKNQS